MAAESRVAGCGVRRSRVRRRTAALRGGPRARGAGPRRARPLTFVVAHGFTNSCHAAPPCALARLALAPSATSVRWTSAATAFGRPFDRRCGDPRAARPRRGRGAPRGPTGRTRWSPSASRWAAAPRCARPPWAGTARTPSSASARSARWYVRDTAPMRRVHWLLETTAGRRIGGAPAGPPARRAVASVPLSPLEAVAPSRPTPLLLVHGDRDDYFPSSTSARWPRRRARRPPRGSSRASDTRRAARPLRSSSGSDAGLLRRSTRDLLRADAPGRRSRAHHLPAAGLAALAVGLLVGLPRSSATSAGWPRCSVLQLGLVLAWVLVTGSGGFAGSLAVGPPRRSPPTWSLVAPRAPGASAACSPSSALGFPAAVLRQMFRRSARPSWSPRSRARHPAAVQRLRCSLLLLGQDRRRARRLSSAARGRRRPGRRAPGRPRVAAAADRRRRAARTARPRRRRARRGRGHRSSAPSRGPLRHTGRAPSTAGCWARSRRWSPRGELHRGARPTGRRAGAEAAPAGGRSGDPGVLPLAACAPLALALAYQTTL